MNDLQPNDENLRFWMCSAISNTRFFRKADAIETARALAADQPGQSVYVLEAVQGYRTPQPKIEMFLMRDPAIE